MNFKTNLMPHQRQAVAKLRKVKVGALYMEQGTGKTRTSLSLIKIRMDAGKINKVLWLCPCSVKENLKEDIIRHCGELPEYIRICGIESISSSNRIYLDMMTYMTGKTYLIVDESNLVKNHKAKRTKRITDMASKCSYKMILNGTPVSKNEADLFAQWYLLDWRILGYRSYWSFAGNHLEFREIKNSQGKKTRTNQIKNVLNVDYLTEKIAPYTYQVRKDECMKLPSKHYHSYNFYMDYEQEREYAKVKYKYLLNVDEFNEATIYKLFTALQHVVSGRSVVTDPEETMRTEPLFYNYLINPRMLKLRDVLEDVILDEKCIIFAKYQSEIDDIQDMIKQMGKSCVIFTGKVSQAQRQENRQSFQGNDVQFLVANKVCGAYGLNMQFCHNIIYYSNDFDLATRLQSEDRVHRIGQTELVNIYDIYCPDTIDEKIVDCLRKKERLVDTFKAEIDKFKNEKSFANWNKIRSEQNG